MRSIIVAHLIIWTALGLALVPWFINASDAMRQCQLKHSLDTCTNTLR